MSGPAFTVDGVFVIEGRGPVLTSRTGIPADTFHPGDIIRCGHRRARIIGVESFAVPGAPQQGLLVDAPLDELAAGQIWVRTHDATDERVAELERTVALLREELQDQWETNHLEHCGRTWPHPEGQTCMWPMPTILLGKMQAR